jgi:hypothetical protein
MRKILLDTVKVGGRFLFTDGFEVNPWEPNEVWMKLDLPAEGVAVPVYRVSPSVNHSPEFATSYANRERLVIPISTRRKRHRK